MDAVLLAALVAGLSALAGRYYGAAERTNGFVSSSFDELRSRMTVIESAVKDIGGEIKVLYRVNEKLLSANYDVLGPIPDTPPEPPEPEPVLPPAQPSPVPEVSPPSPPPAEEKVSPAKAAAILGAKGGKRTKDVKGVVRDFERLLDELPKNVRASAKGGWQGLTPKYKLQNLRDFAHGRPINVIDIGLKAWLAKQPAESQEEYKEGFEVVRDSVREALEDAGDKGT